MSERQDIEARRAQDRMRWHRRVADRRARGTCIRCGKRPPEPHRSECGPCADKRRKADLERHRRRTAERAALDLCPRCGKREPEPGRTLCAPCGEKRNRAGRARDARLHAAGIPRRDPDRKSKRDRFRCERAKRAAQGVCTRCGKRPAMSGRKSCEPCLEKKRAADRAKYAAGKAAGLKYGGADPKARREAGRARSRRRQKARIEAGLCIRCGRQPPVEGGATCRPCRDRRQAAERRQYRDRRESGLCTRCGGPTVDGLSRCTPCSVIEEASHDPERKNARSRKLYSERRARGLCTSCGTPSQGASRCELCAEKSYHRSAHFRGIPVSDPTWTVIEVDTGREHGPFDDPADVALCLAFEKLDRDRVEVLCDAPVTASITAWT